jgi:Tfp pilus assembly protein PilF
LRNDIEPCAFSTKWIGTISLFRNQLKLAEKHLTQSLMFDRKDAQVWYNLAGVYVQGKDYQKALQTVNEALSLQPHYREALALQMKLQEVVK